MNRDKVRGMLLGVAIGDQLGMPVETYSKDKIQKMYGRIVNYIDPAPDHKRFGGIKSQWTDDTQLTLAVAESLIAKKCIDMDDMAKRHIESFQKEGDLGFGNSTRYAIKNLIAGTHWSGSGAPNGVGNGVAMKIAPLVIYCIYFNLYLSIHYGELTDFTIMTHRTRLAVESAFAQVMALRHCLGLHIPKNFSSYLFLSDIRKAVLAAKKYWDDSTATLNEPLCKLENLIRAKEQTLIKSVDQPLLNELSYIRMFGGGVSYVYHSLPFSYAFFLTRPLTIETLYDVVNAGGDTDTNGSIVGALLGALNGSSIFPKHLVYDLYQKDRILDTAERLCDAFKIKD